MNFMFIDKKLCRRKALTMIEIALAIVILAAALLPVFMLTTNTAAQTISMEKHLMASQFASNILDKYLALPFKVCVKNILKEKYPKKILDSDAYANFTNKPSFSDALKKTFNEFKYEIKLEEPPILNEFGEMFRITINVSWPSSSSAKTMRQFSLNAVKFNENP